MENKEKYHIKKAKIADAAFHKNHDCCTEEHDNECECEQEHDHEHERRRHHEHDHHHAHHHDRCGCGHNHHDDCGCGHDHHDELGGSHQAAAAKAPVDDYCLTCQKRFDECRCPTPAGYEQRIYIVEDLGCANCAAKMERKIRELPEVFRASITYTTRQLRVTAKAPEALLPTLQKICQSIESQVTLVDRDQSMAASSGTGKSENPASFLERLKVPGFILSAVLIICGEIFHEVYGSGALPWYLSALYIALYVILGWRILLEAFKNILHGQIFDENFLMSIATLGALVIGKYGEAAGVMLFYCIGEYFEERAVERSRSQIMSALDMRPEVVTRLNESNTETIPASEARVGDLLIVRPGDRIPLDGIVVDGESRIDTSPLTGEPVPVKAAPGSSVLSGCVNTSGRLIVRTEKVLSESMVTRIMNSVENAAASKPKIDRFITRFSHYYTPAVILLALLTAILPPLLFAQSWQTWIYTALTFLVMSCPCALVLSVPLAYFSGIGAGSKKGILFKGGASIEAIQKIKAVVMDKTGTITKGNFVVSNILPQDQFSEHELLALAAGCELASTHPIAVSIIDAANERQLHIEKPEAVEEIAGFGIRAEIDGHTVLCGNKKLMDKYQITMPNGADASALTEVYLAKDQNYAGSIQISDTLKPNAKKAIAALKKLGLSTAMLTGDAVETANAVAMSVGIDEVYARLLPEDKLENLQKIRAAKGGVMFVGDGINDAPVLAGADVGAAMGSGSDAAIEAADVVFMTSEVTAIPEAISIARRANRIALENVCFALVIKAAVMIMGLCGISSMWLAVFADTGVAILCILNSVRILYRKS